MADKESSFGEVQEQEDVVRDLDEVNTGLVLFDGVCSDIGRSNLTTERFF